MPKNNKNNTNNYLVYKFWKKISKAFTKEQKEKIVPVEQSSFRCFYCGNKKVYWKNSTTNDLSCKDCVPRGCSCKLYKVSKRTNFSIDDYQYELDSDGLELPCEEWEKL